MPFVIKKLEHLEKYTKKMEINEKLSKWVIKALKKEVVTRREWLTKSLSAKSDDEHIQRAIDNNEDIYEITFCDDMKNEIQYVIDWLAELEQRDARLFAKLDRITWKQAVEHSKRWHEALARKAEKLELEAIPFDENCPVVFECDDGLKWVWLKTEKAKDDESILMGHCVGQGGYDILDKQEAVFSLRDKNGKPHVTIYIDGFKIIEKKMKGNNEVSNKYDKHIQDLSINICPRLIAKNDPTISITESEVIFPSDDIYERIKFVNGQIHDENTPAITFYDGSREWYRNGLRHREDGPAIEYADGSKQWYRNGLLHRENGPAIECWNGRKDWYINGKRHREGGPAIEDDNDDEKWYRNGLLHREDGPAVITKHGTKKWFRNGELHNENGPAIIWSDGSKHWYLNNKCHRLNGPAVENTNGTEEWYLNGDLHREDGPALTERERKEWWVNGRQHRLGGPAVEYTNGKKEWWIDGERHREDGPAIEWHDGKNEWYQHGKLHRLDGPAEEHPNGSEYWYLNGRQHREDGPAVTRATGLEEWWLHGERHRTNGPAITKENGDLEWWIDGNLTKRKSEMKNNYLEPNIIKKITVTTYRNKSKYMTRTFTENKDGQKHFLREWFDMNHELHRILYPSTINMGILPDNSKFIVKLYNRHGHFHRDDGPAVIASNGLRMWYKNGERHREDGPAVIQPDGSEEWFMNGTKIDHDIKIR